MELKDAREANDDRILDAALRALVDFGVEHATVKSIAKYADVSHMTVYRRWPAKNTLLITAVMRELDRLFNEAQEAAAKERSFEDKIITGFVAVYWGLQTHPLMTREMRSEPDVALRLLTHESGPAQAVATDFAVSSIARAAKSHDVDLLKPRTLAEMLVRMVHSLLLAPPRQPALATKADVRRYARRFVLPIVRAVIENADRS
ncbi:TetR/AcrR family transcriptional regulator [Mycobacterium sp. PDNC021]|uniref:TetR/AcrR family transcriptional regulator n=1 Tax=Mycobacterium sp. PDNC021 TaxID=3391399 RepID=UPI003AAD3033